ncbi:uncharacterized protein B0H64DRAFT_419172 [Chaetomium fimeti]|uniref:Zn(2)-C6 fungal-type domain-containing protein n=1 Tax=Chaetomium fimeti TaxID=1854472 RepID=A0AAE0HBB3_9PEZI|nr:hypothetical protein B0H64DRAFT_419172 [Chaetomium fimeti]
MRRGGRETVCGLNSANISTGSSEKTSSLMKLPSFFKKEVASPLMKRSNFGMQAFPNSGPMPAGYGQPTTALPLLSLDNGENAGFDYSNFLQDQQDIDYLAEDSSGSAGGLPIATPSPSSSFSDQQMQALAPRQQQQHPPASARQLGYGGPTATRGSSGGSPEDRPLPKQRLERRGHTKSRRGCFNCKRRRIKCQETRPACGHCVKQGLKCEYPTLPTIVHQYEYLMHAILGYSASELMAASDPSLAEAAMSHRYKAVKAIKKALAPPPSSPAGTTSPPNNSSNSSSSSSSNNNNGRSFDDTMFEEGNALMATCFALTFQSVLLEDGMAEFMTFIRGIMIVAIQMYCSGASLLFGEMLGDRQTQLLEPHMRELGLIDADLTARAIRAIEGLRGLVEGVEGREVECKYWEMVAAMARNLAVSSWKAYFALTEHYGWWMMLPHAKFQPLVDPNNQVALLLSAHWVALEQIMGPICETEHKVSASMSGGRSSNAGASLGNIRWLRYLNNQLDAEHRLYNEWPMWVEAQLARDIRCFRKADLRVG